MLRDKKNKIRTKEKQVKLRIKHLKNQLGRVKSGKEAKILKRKRIGKKSV
jgi:50S ribosomal subunit-associated GTPase HflX